MLPELEQLLILQDKDQTLKRLNLDLKRFPQEQERAKNKLAADTESVKQAKAKLQENEIATKNLELQIGTRKESISRMKVQQMETRKNDQYTALGNEIVRYQAEVTKLEDSEIELMEQAEVLKAAVAAAQDALRATQAKVDEELQLLGKRLVNVGAQLQETQGARDEYAKKIDEDLLEKYSRIWRSTGDSAVVELVGGVCKGCHMKVSPGTLVEAKADTKIVHCSNCGRLVFVAY